MPTSHQTHSQPSRPAVQEQAARWWLQHREGRLDDPAGASALAFGRWLAADDAHRAAWDDLMATARALDDLPIAEVENLRAQARASTARAFGASPAELPGRAPLQHPPRRAWLTQAVTASLAVTAVGGVVWWVADMQQQPVFVKAHSTRRGQLLTVPLPDGSVVQLDTATQLRVAFYRDRREVQLVRGQAVFAVAADAARPFHVDAGATRVSVVGTRFQVRHVDDGVGVEVEYGRVRVRRRAPEADDAVLLTAGQSVQADAAGRLSQVVSVAAATIAPWRSGRLSFDDTPLAAALAEFARYGETHLAVDDPRVAALRVTGSFEIAKLQDFALALPQVLPVRLQPRDRVTEIVGR